MQFRVHLRREVVQCAVLMVDASCPLEAAVLARQYAEEKEPQLVWVGTAQPVIVTRADLARATGKNLARAVRG